MTRFAIVILFASTLANADIVVNHRCGVVESFIGTYQGQKIHAINKSGMTQPITRFEIIQGSRQILTKMILDSHRPGSKTRFIIMQDNSGYCYKI